MKNENDVKTHEEQQIETIRERKITVKLSDEDCDRLARKCGEHGLTIGELIENFIGDLCGTVVRALLVWNVSRTYTSEPFTVLGR